MFVEIQRFQKFGFEALLVSKCRGDAVLSCGNVLSKVRMVPDRGMNPASLALEKPRGWCSCSGRSSSSSLNAIVLDRGKASVISKGR
jgi:hypothetical protein